MVRICALLLAMAGVAFADQDKPTSPPKAAVPAQTGTLRTQKSTAKPEQSASLVTAVAKQENPPADRPNEFNYDENIRIQGKLANLTTWLVIVGFLQALILAVTVVVLARQTSVARNTERAWITVASIECAGSRLYPRTGKLHWRQRSTDKYLDLLFKKYRRDACQARRFYRQLSNG